MKPVLLAAALLALSAPTLGAATLSELRWQKRVLILFAATRSQVLDDQSRHLLADRDGLAERDMVVFAVVGPDAIRPVYGDAPGGEDANALRDRYQVAADEPFAAVLIGKDGGVKWRDSKPVELPALNAVIDAMPMRRGGGG